MCRFAVYLGKPRVMAEILSEPENSLIKQSKQAKEMVVTAAVNGDGFGVGWDNLELDEEPALFKSIRPAWNDVNLDYLLPKIKSPCFFGHIRAAVHGGVSTANSHPFQYKHFMFMHNGTIGGFATIKRHMRHLLSDEMYDWIKGETDSEHIAALFLEKLKKEKDHNVSTLAKVLQEVFRIILSLQKEFGVDDELTVLNYVVTDGKRLVVTRFSNDDEHASTLYHALCQDDVLVVSEKLDDHLASWEEVPKNHILTVDVTGELKIKEVL